MRTPEETNISDFPRYFIAIFFYKTVPVCQRFLENMNFIFFSMLVRKALRKKCFWSFTEFAFQYDNVDLNEDTYCG